MNDDYLYTEWVRSRSHLTYSDYLVSIQHSPQALDLFCKASASQQEAWLEEQRRRTAEAKRAYEQQLQQQIAREQARIEREAKALRAQAKERQRRKDEYEEKRLAQLDAIELEPASPSGRGRHAGDYWEPGHGEVADEFNDALNIPALRLSGHGPEPDAEDDNPGWVAARSLDNWLNPTLDERFSELNQLIIYNEQVRYHRYVVGRTPLNAASQRRSKGI